MFWENTRNLFTLQFWQKIGAHYTYIHCSPTVFLYMFDVHWNTDVFTACLQLKTGTGGLRCITAYSLNTLSIDVTLSIERLYRYMALDTQVNDLGFQGRKKKTDVLVWSVIGHSAIQGFRNILWEWDTCWSATDSQSAYKYQLLGGSSTKIFFRCQNLAHTSTERQR